MAKDYYIAECPVCFNQWDCDSAAQAKAKNRAWWKRISEIVTRSNADRPAQVGGRVAAVSVAHAVDWSTWREDLDRALDDPRTMFWDTWVIPGEALRLTVINEVWVAQPGWPEAKIMVAPLLMRRLRRYTQ